MNSITCQKYPNYYASAVMSPLSIDYMKHWIPPRVSPYSNVGRWLLCRRYSNKISHSDVLNHIYGFYKWLFHYVCILTTISSINLGVRRIHRGQNNVSLLFVVGEAKSNAFPYILFPIFKIPTPTVISTWYPKKYGHSFCFAVLCCGYTLTDSPISIRLTSLALWQSNDCPSASKATLMNMDKYFMWIHYERLHNHNKAKHNKTVCIFLGIYCTGQRMKSQHWCG